MGRQVLDALRYPLLAGAPSLDIGSSPGGWTKVRRHHNPHRSPREPRYGRCGL
jgi:hypothetical protein